MPTLLLILVNYAAIGLQRGLDAWLTVGGARADVPLISAVFTALLLPGPVGPLAALLVGLAVDVTGTGPPGPHAAAYGLAGWVAVSLRGPRVDRRLRMWGIVGGCAFVSAMTLWLGGRLSAGDWGPTFGEATLGGLLTVLLAGVLIPLLWPLRPIITVRDRPY